ncbi:MAG: hypothetical protein V1802_00265 [Candidatus Aenigmatarchaeota archaeon]
MNKHDAIVYILVVLILVFSVVNIYIFASRAIISNQIENEKKEAARPANIEITKIVFSECTDCYNISNAVDEISSHNVKITSEKTVEFGTDEAKSLIESYEIQKLPALVIKGELNKSEELAIFWNSAGKVSGNGIVYTIQPPYYSILEKHIVGLVNITMLLDSSCEKCAGIAGLPFSLKQLGVKITDEKIIEYNSSEGKMLMSKFDIKQIPSIVISKEVTAYDALKQAWSQLNTTEKDGYYAIHSRIPPYRDLLTNKIVGLLTLITINDSTCSECYDASINKLILFRFGAAVENESAYDINSVEGKKLSKKYNITKVPIILMSPDASVYTTLVEAWKEVGTVESDDWYVMRNPDILGTYKDLITNKTVVMNTTEEV